MARDFKIELDNVEMINGSDNLLKDTKVTKVTITGENKLNSLNSTFENCTELTSIEGEINLDGISDMTEMALNTTLDELKIINPTEENIQTDNSLNQVTNVKIGGTKYTKGGVQDVVGSLEWTAENFTYEDAILDNVYTNSSSIEESKNITVSDTLEQKATSIEITGQTYENLVNGKATKNLLDKMSMQQTEGKPTQFTPHMEQPICLEYIEGQTYQNLVDGKGEYKLTDTFSSTWTVGLRANTDYTLQLDSTGKDDKPITVNLGGTETNIQPTNDTKKHHKVVVRTPATLTNDTLELSGEGVIVNDVMLFKGGSNDIKQEVKYIDGIENIGEDILNDIHDNIISWLDFNDLDNSINPTIWIDKTRKGNDFILEGFDFDGVTNGIIDGGLQVKKGAKIKANKTYNNIKSMILCVNPRSGDIGQIDIFGTSPISIRCCFREGDKYPYIAGVSGKNITSNKIINSTSSVYNLLNNEYNILYFELNDDISSVQNLIFGYDKNSNAQTTFKSMMLFDRKLNENEIKYMGNLCFDANSTYKIDILSNSGKHNLFDINNVTIYGADVVSNLFIEVNEGDIYSSFSSRSDGWMRFQTFNSSKTLINGSLGNIQSNRCTVTIPSGVKYIKPAFSAAARGGAMTVKGSTRWDYIPYTPYYETKQSILLPQPLNKIGDIKDRFYWDENKGHYCIEQNITITVFDGSDDEGWEGRYLSGNEDKSRHCYNALNILVYPKDAKTDNVVLCDKLTWRYAHDWGTTGVPIEDEFLINDNRFCVFKSSISTVSEFKEWISQNPITLIHPLETPIIIDLPYLNQKFLFDTYLPNTSVKVTNLPLQPYKLQLEDDTLLHLRFSTLEPSTLYTIQFNCVSKSTTKLTLDLRGTRVTVEPIIGLNHVQITTPSVLASDRLFFIGTGIVVKEVIVNKGYMAQYPKYFDGEQSVGELQTDGSYKIVIKTNEGFTVTIRTSSPLTKLDKIYWNDTEKRYEIDRNGAIEVPTVEGDIINLPRLYQKVDTTISISTDNIEPSKIDISYKDIH